MATRPIITNQGLALLASSSQSTGQNYWLGYYLLSYVPNIWKTDTSIAFPDPECGNVGSGTVIQTTDTDNVVPSMTRITKYGDVIYNIWQGDVVGTGYGYEGSDGTVGGELFGMSYYDTSIKKHYRYVLDENGVNNLVAWSDDINDLMLGKTAYAGTDGYYQSAIPIPASLYYLPSTNGPHISVADYFPDFNDEENNGSSIYPYIDVTYKLNSIPESITVPKVSTDYRAYTDSLGGSSNPSTGGAYFNDVEIPYPTATGYDESSWFAASKTQMVDYEELTGFSTICREMWKLHTISNYNRFHAPVSEVGQVMNSDISSRNMSTLTKYFPISNYKVINSERGVRDNGATIEVATALAITIDIDLAPKVLAPGYSTDGTYDEQGNLTFFDSYNNPANPLTPYDQNGNSIFNTTHTSFKFNRIGIYAVAMRQAPYVADGIDENGVNKVQFEINPDAEPILFAVVDWDNTVTLDDSGNGIHQFRAELNVNLESSDGSTDPTPLLRDATIFYNLYQDDALTWYQNQLIANASISNAVTELALEVASIKKISKADPCCGKSGLNDEYALKNHSHAMLRNLLDANSAFDGGLKGIDTFKEGAIFETDPYKLGKYSVVLGKGTVGVSDYSSVMGLNSYIYSNCDNALIGNGISNSIRNNSSRASILNGFGNGITTSTMATIFNGTSSSITNSARATLNGDDSDISSSAGSRIFGDTCSISNSLYADIIGASNTITASSGARINGSGCTITTSPMAQIVGGGCVITTSSDARINGSGSITNSSNASISGGGNTITSSANSHALGGAITITNSNYSISVGGGNQLTDSGYNTIFGSSCSIISSIESHISGCGSSITSSSTAHVHGSGNILLSSPNSGVYGYGNNLSYSSGISVLGNGNHVAYAVYSSILGGAGHSINGGNFDSTVYNSTIVSGRGNIIAPLRGDTTSAIGGSLILTGSNAHASHDGEVTQSAYIGFYDGADPIIGGAQVSRIVRALEIPAGEQLEDASDYITIAYIDVPAYIGMIGKITLSALAHYPDGGSYQSGMCLSEFGISIMGKNALGDMEISFGNSSVYATPTLGTLIYRNDSGNMASTPTVDRPRMRISAPIAGPTYTDNGFVVNQNNRINIQVARCNNDASSYQTKFVMALDYTQIRAFKHGQTNISYPDADITGNPIM